MDLRAAYDDAVLALVNDTQVIIRMLLPLRAKAAVPFHVALRHRHAVVALSTELVVFLYSLFVLGLATLGHLFGNDMEGEESIGADLFDQHHQGRPFTRAGGDQTAALEQVLSVAWQMVIT